MDTLLKEAVAATPDPDRCLRNLTSFIEQNPARVDELQANIRNISMLFSHSQFLANYSTANPDELFHALSSLDVPPDREVLASALKQKLGALGGPQRTLMPLFMNVVRRFRVKEFLKITLRDILKKADLVDVMIEMSMLADVIIEEALSVVRAFLHGIYGQPDDEQFSVIALGKLGAEELNYSSDVDFIYVYGSEIGETSGVITEQGARKNRISNHEYYCKVGEEIAKFLSQHTEAGFAYRVDLRLRPEGQRGALALALRGYEMYYESWGRAWERAMLLRARPVAGEERLSADFMEMIRPFVFRKYLDFSAIEEISKLKTRIDATFKKNDIKRGYGGIREIEFFSQALQLIYAGREPLLRERSTLRTLHRLFQKGLIGRDDYGTLSENYCYLRTLEHRLQQVNDLQTHSLPAGEAELNALAGKMGYAEKKQFIDDLEGRRTRTRTIYDSLFMGRNEESTAGSTLFDEEFTDAELKEFLARTGLTDIDKALRNIRSIRDSVYNFQTLRSRRLLSEILPLFVDSALRSVNADSALNHIQSFAVLLSTNEAYLEVFSKNRALIDRIVYVFSQSNYLSKILMAKPQYLEMIGLQEPLRKGLGLLQKETREFLDEGRSISDAIRLIKQMEEIRVGMLFLEKRIDLLRTIHALSRTAEAILSVTMEQTAGPENNVAVISFGKLGGREITFSSDLDLIFVSADDVTLEQTKACEKLLRTLISYTKEGIAYSVDTRLRPEGSKGPLVASVETFRRYYAEAAAFWEFQALLKARPVAGDSKTGCAFMQMAHESLVSHGSRITAADIRQMRERIVRELSKEAEGYDIKLGHGGIEDIEFTVQYLQLKHGAQQRGLIVQSTLAAIHRLTRSGMLSVSEGRAMKSGYLFFRTIEGFLRLRGEGVLKRNEESLKSAAEFMGFKDPPAFKTRLDHMRASINEITGRYLKGS